MNAKPYPKYKPSGVEWLGDVPDHWEVKPLKFFLVRNDGGVWGEDEVDDEGTIVLRSTEQTAAGEWKIEDPAKRKLSLSESRYCRLATGDLVVTKSSGSEHHIGKTSLVTNEVAGLNACYSNFMQRLRCSALLNPKIAFYYLNSPAGRLQGVVKSSTSTGLANLNGTTLGGILLAVPPFQEQQFIADFLDDRTAKLDALLEKKRALIGKLKEKRSALISRTVTKGLSPEAATQAGLTPNPKLKPSGIPWLGDIPEHWDISKAGHFISITSGFAFPSDGFSHDENDTKLLRGVNIGVSRIRWDDTVYWPRKDGDQLKRYELKAGDLVLGMDRPWISEGMRVARISENDLPCLLLQRVVLITTSDSLSKEFLFRLLSCQVFIDYFTPEVTGVSVPHISPEQISSFVIPLPPLNEQLLINDLLERRTAMIDRMIQKVESAIEKLTEYRTALITAAVTGKIDVRKLH